MKDTKVIIHNKSKLPLKVTSVKKNSSERIEFKVKRRSSLKLEPGQYNIAFYYYSAQIELKSNMNENLNISYIHSQSNNQFLGKLIEVSYPQQPIVIECNHLN